MPEDDHSSEPSLFLARQAQHEHHIHLHRDFHRRGTSDVTVTVDTSVVTQVTTTISVIQQIDVNSNGQTLSVLIVPESATGHGSQAVLTATSSNPLAAFPSSAASGSLSTAFSAATETKSPSLVSQSWSSSLSASSASTSTPFTSTSVASLSTSSNSTTLVPSSSSLSHTFANSSSLSSSRSSLTYLISSLNSSTSSQQTLTTSLSSPSSISSTSSQSTSTGAFGGAGEGTTATPGTAPASTVASGGGGNSTSPVSTPTVVGGVVGSIAGVAVIVLLLLFIIKWKKDRNGTLLSLGSGRDGAGDSAGVAAGTGAPTSQPPGAMAERRPLAFAVPAAFANMTGFKRSSRQTDRTTSSTAGSETGFYRVSGRKLPSVLQTGGDGYGGGIPNDYTLSGSSFYQDSHGFYGGPGTPGFSPLEPHRESGQIGTPVMRPSPARTPVTEQGPFAFPSQDPLPPRPDVLGRSHSSQDGSHASRFTEEV